MAKCRGKNSQWTRMHLQCAASKLVKFSSYRFKCITHNWIMIVVWLHHTKHGLSIKQSLQCLLVGMVFSQLLLHIARLTLEQLVLIATNIAAVCVCVLQVTYRDCLLPHVTMDPHDHCALQTRRMVSLCPHASWFPSKCLIAGCRYCLHCSHFTSWALSLRTNEQMNTLVCVSPY